MFAKKDCQALLAEFIGTFALTSVVLFSLNSPDFPIPTPVLAALALGLFVYTVGQISGAHLNPAVTLALLSLKQISAPLAVGYLVVQFAAALVAMGVAQPFISVGGVLSVGDNLMVLAAEVMGTFVLTFGVASVVLKKAADTTSAFVVGLSLLLGISLAAIASNGVLNPAVALGIGSFSVHYVLGPILGGLAGVWVCKGLYEM